MDPESLERDNDRGLDSLSEKIGLLKHVGACSNLQRCMRSCFRQQYNLHSQHGTSSHCSTCGGMAICMTDAAARDHRHSCQGTRAAGGRTEGCHLQHPLTLVCVFG